MKKHSTFNIQLRTSKFQPSGVGDVGLVAADGLCQGSRRGGPTFKKRLTSAACGVPSRRDALTIARSFNCGWRVANDTRPAGTAEPVRFETSKSTDHHELQSSRWDELCVRPPHPQLKLRAITKRAAGAPLPAVRMEANDLVAQARSHGSGGCGTRSGPEYVQFAAPASVSCCISPQRGAMLLTSAATSPADFITAPAFVVGR